MSQADNCPCGSQLKYADCCQRLHLGKAKASNAEQLMRSRYSAFVQQNIDYLIDTLHPTQRQTDDREVLQQTCQNTRWLGLQIVKSQDKKDTAKVEFVAFYEDSPIGQLHERSNFVLEAGLWFYLDGEFLPAIKLGRNDRCICGSGKKLKHCHAA